MAEGEFTSIVILKDGQYNFLIDNAIRSIWCNPDQDNQHIFGLHRITHPIGVLNNVSVLQRNVKLPTNGVKYHLFQIGHLQPELIGLLKDTKSVYGDEWVSFSEAMNAKKLIVDIYVDAGIQVPRFEVFYRFMNEKNLIIAIRQDTNIPVDFSTDNFFLRVYSNAYFYTLRSKAQEEGIYCYGEVIKNKNQILAIQDEVNRYTLKKGEICSFVNGLLTDKIDLTTTKIGDTVEFIYDSSIKRSVVFTIPAIPTFVSDLDSLRKYIIHYVGADQNTIDYLDDNDIFVCYASATARYRGLYFNRNNANAVRMLTHRDYSVPVNYVSRYIDKLIDLDATRNVTANFKLRINIRESGYSRPLSFESSRILELYKLPSASILNALKGNNFGIPMWTAKELEKSAYVEVMGSKASDIDVPLISDAYGYNAVSSLLGSTPQKVKINNGAKYVTVPHGLLTNSTAYEYDVNGKFLTKRTHTGGAEYYCYNSNAVIVEMFAGIGDYNPEVVFGHSGFLLPTFHGYRVYRCTKTETGYDGKWVDVTGMSNYYTIVNGRILWSASDPNAYVMVRTDKKLLTYGLVLKSIHGCIRFTFSENEVHEGVRANYIMPVPMGRLDIFMNEHLLIEDVDYIVNFPEVVIFNKEYLNAPRASADQRIHVRWSGFCKSDLTRENDADIGWVKHGLLSENNAYDIRDDRVLQIVMKGGVYHRDSLFYSETSSGLGITNSRNGYPYMIRDYVVPMKNHVNQDTYAYRKIAQETDSVVSNFLSTLLPEPDDRGLSAITKRYEVFSPFIAKILYDLEVKLITTADIASVVTDQQTIDFCKPYEEWLRFDPTQVGHQLDSDFVIVHPNNDYKVIPLNIIQYRFIRRVVNLYCNGLVDLSAFISLTEEI